MIAALNAARLSPMRKAVLPAIPVVLQNADKKSIIKIPLKSVKQKNSITLTKERWQNN